MKLLIALILLSFQCHAFEIKSVPMQNSAGVFQIFTQIQCQNLNDDSCQKICGVQDVCNRPEPTCLNCAGTANELIRILFTRLDSFYQSSPEHMSGEELIEYIATQKYVLLSSHSVYNFHKAWDAPETLALFQSFCDLPTEQPLLLVQLDNIGQPVELKAVICQDSMGSYAQKVQARSAAIEPIKMDLK